MPSTTAGLALGGVNGSNADYDAATSVTHDKQGNIYLAGNFKGSIIIGVDTFNSFGNNDVFLVKYSPDGNVVWARSGGSVAEETIKAITLDTNGNIYVTGSFGGHYIYPVNYTDTAYFSDSLIISKSRMDAFLISYDTSGTIRWIKSYGSEYSDEGVILATNKENKIIFGGNFSDYGGSPPVHGTISFHTIQLTSNGDNDFLYVR